MAHSLSTSLSGSSSGSFLGKMNGGGGAGGGGSGGVKKERRGKRAELPEDVAKKLKSCSVLGCEEWRDLTSHTTYHCFPTGDKNQQRWEIWTHLLQKARDDTSWIPFRGSLVCSHHFRPQDFVLDPNQKRTKLLKNSIPSIFPTFQVDLDDPSFTLDESGDDNCEYDVNAFEDYEQEQECESAEYSNGYDYRPVPVNDVDVEGQNVAQINYQDEVDEHVEVDEIPELEYVRPSSNKNKIQSRALPKLTPGVSYIRKQNEMQASSIQVEPPRKKFASAMVASQNKEIFVNKLQPQSAPRRSLPIQTSTSSSFSNYNVQANSHTSNQSKLYKQLCKSTNANSTTKLPFSWNPDLEIEVLSNSNDDDDGSIWKQRVEELESEKEVLQEKYEAQIRALQRKVKQQYRIINQYATEIQMMQGQHI